MDLERHRRIGAEAADRVSVALARAAGAAETLDPPAVHPVIAVVGAILAGDGRHRGVTVTRVGQLPRLLTAFGRSAVRPGGRADLRGGPTVGDVEPVT